MTLPIRAFLTYETEEVGEFHQEIHVIELLSGRVINIKDINTDKLSLGFDREVPNENESSNEQTLLTHFFMPLYHAYGEFPGEERVYGKCDFENDFAMDTTEPYNEVKGDIARIYFYMAKEYGVQLTNSEKLQYLFWDEIDKHRNGSVQDFCVYTPSNN